MGLFEYHIVSVSDGKRLVHHVYKYELHLRSFSKLKEARGFVVDDIKDCPLAVLVYEGCLKHPGPELMYNPVYCWLSYESKYYKDRWIQKSSNYGLWRSGNALD